MALVEQNLRGNVLGRATQRVRSGARFNDLCKTEVCELRISVLAQENVLRLQVAVDDVLAVDVRKCTSNLCCIKLGLLIGELAGTAKVSKELPTTDALHHYVYEAVILRVARHIHDERIINLCHEPFFVVDVIYLLQLDDFVLLHEFDRIELPILLVLGKLDTAKRSTSQCAGHLKIC